MKERLIRVNTTDMALLVVSFVFLAGMLLAFGPCGQNEDGSWMTCHWAGVAITGTAGVLAAVELFHTLFSSPGIRQGLDLAALTVTAFTVLLPGRLIPLCMVHTMRCHRMMAPAAAVFAGAIALLSAVDLLIQFRRDWKAKREAAEAIRTVPAPPEPPGPGDIQENAAPAESSEPPETESGGEENAV